MLRISRTRCKYIYIYIYLSTCSFLFVCVFTRTFVDGRICTCHVQLLTQGDPPKNQERVVVQMDAIVPLCSLSYYQIQLLSLCDQPKVQQRDVSCDIKRKAHILQAYILYAYIQREKYMYRYISLSIYIHELLYGYMYIYIYTNIYIYIGICIYTYIYIYTADVCGFAWKLR